MRANWNRAADLLLYTKLSYDHLPVCLVRFPNVGVIASGNFCRFLHITLILPGSSQNFGDSKYVYRYIVYRGGGGGIFDKRKGTKKLLRMGEEGGGG